MIDRDQLREAIAWWDSHGEASVRGVSNAAFRHWMPRIMLAFAAARLVADPDTLVITKDDVEQAVRTNPTQRTRWPIWALEILIPWGAAENADYHPHAILDALLEGQPK